MNFIERIIGELLDQNADLSQTALVLPGKRPVVFIKKILSEKGYSGLLPEFFTIEELISDIAGKPEMQERRERSINAGKGRGESEAGPEEGGRSTANSAARGRAQEKRSRRWDSGFRWPAPRPRNRGIRGSGISRGDRFSSRRS